MRKYIYLIIDEDKNVVAIYERKDVAEKLAKPIGEKINKAVTIKEQRLNPDIKIVGL